VDDSRAAFDDYEWDELEEFFDLEREVILYPFLSRCKTPEEVHAQIQRLVEMLNRVDWSAEIKQFEQDEIEAHNHYDLWDTLRDQDEGNDTDDDFPE
jgi:hypothetical protein